MKKIYEAVDETSFRQMAVAQKKAIMNGLAMHPDVPLEYLELGLRDNSPVVRQAAAKACTGRKNLNEAIIKALEEEIKSSNKARQAAAIAALKDADIPSCFISDLFEHKDKSVRMAAAELCRGRDVPVNVLERGLAQKDWEVSNLTAEVAGEKKLPTEALIRWSTEGRLHFAFAALRCCERQKFAADDLREMAGHEDWRVRELAATACLNAETAPALEILISCLADPKGGVRQAALASAKRHAAYVPMEALREMAASTDENLRFAAWEIGPGRLYSGLRTFEPTGTITVGCLNCSALEVVIPEDAEIRGWPVNIQCRTNKAKVVRVLGGDIGFPAYDPTTGYEAGDEIVCDDFDYTLSPDGKGIKFIVKED